MTVAAAAALADDRNLRRDRAAPAHMRSTIGPPQAESPATMPAPGDSAPTLMRQGDDSGRGRQCSSVILRWPALAGPRRTTARLLRHRGRASFEARFARASG